MRMWWHATPILFLAVRTGDKCRMHYRLSHCAPTRQRISTRACVVDARALRAPKTRSGHRLLPALSIRNHRYSISVRLWDAITPRVLSHRQRFSQRACTFLTTVRAALIAAPGVSTPPSLWHPLVLELLYLTLLHLSIFALLRSCALALLNMRPRKHRNAIRHITGASNARRAFETSLPSLRTSCDDGYHVVMADSFRCNS